MVRKLITLNSYTFILLKKNNCFILLCMLRACYIGVFHFKLHPILTITKLGRIMWA